MFILSIRSWIRGTILLSSPSGDVLEYLRHGKFEFPFSALPINIFVVHHSLIADRHTRLPLIILPSTTVLLFGFVCLSAIAELGILDSSLSLKRPFAQVIAHEFIITWLTSKKRLVTVQHPQYSLIAQNHFSTQHTTTLQDTTQHNTHTHTHTHTHTKHTKHTHTLSTHTTHTHTHTH